jgi:branched-chain amino acid transport system ATP-binding protein
MPQDLTQVDLRKLDLARAMIAKPQLLFVDEVMAGLSHSEVDEILAVLMRTNENAVAIVMIEHIMRAVTAFSQRLVVLVAGRKIADGDPEHVLANVEVQRAYLGE